MQTLIAWFIQHGTVDAGTIAGVAGILIRHYAPKVYAALTSAQGKAVIADVPQLAADVERALKDAGHPLNPGAQATIAGVLNALPKAVAVVALALMLALGPKLCPAAGLTLAAGNSAIVGASVMDFGPGGSLVSTGGFVAGDQLDLGYGTTQANNIFSYDLLLSLGLGIENAPGATYLDLVTGIGTAIPDTSSNAVLGPLWRLGSGQAHPAIGLQANFLFGQPFWTH